MRLTENEIKVLEAIVRCEYHDGRDPVNDQVWSFACNPFENKTIYPGVCSSLSKKGLAGFKQGEQKNGGDIVWITEKGIEVLNNLEKKTNEKLV